MQAGGPGSYRAPTPGEHGQPASAATALLATAKLKAEEAATGLLKKVINPAGEVSTEFLGVGLAAIARTASLTAGILLTPTNSPDDPGYASEWEMYRRNRAQFPAATPDQLRLAQLEHLHGQGNLTAEEEAELILLLAKVKGIHVQRLSDLTDLYPVHEFNGHHINLRSCPIIIPPSASITEQAKSGYDQVKFKWTREPYGYEARWHTRTPGAPATQGDTWVITRTTPGTAQGQRKAQHILTGPNQWTPVSQWQSAVSANQVGTATETQKLLLSNGHWNASN